MNKMMAIIASLSNETVDGQMSKNHKRYTTGVKTKRSTLSVSADRSVPSSSSDDPDFSVGQSRSGVTGSHLGMICTEEAGVGVYSGGREGASFSRLLPNPPPPPP